LIVFDPTVAELDGRTDGALWGGQWVLRAISGFLRHWGTVRRGKTRIRE